MKHKKYVVALIQMILFVAIIAAGLKGAKWLIEHRKQVQKIEQKILPTLVEVATTKRQDVTIKVPAMGTVVAAYEVTITPEVMGKVVETSPALIPGGWLEKGDVIARIDKREYELAVVQQEGAVEQARFNLKVEEGRQVIAQREWKLVGARRNLTETSKELTLRKPHLQNTRIALSAALSGLDRAKLNVERTVIRAPFNAIVKEKSVDVGQVVNAQSRIATLVGRDHFWVRASLPVERLKHIALPDRDGKGGARAQIIQDTGNGHPIIREGEMVRLQGDIDPAGKLARVLIVVRNPLKGTGLPLLLGAYVRVEIAGIHLADVVPIPREALHEGNQVWLMATDDTLEIRPVEIVWRRRDDVLISSGLGNDERMVTSRISTPIPGMKLRIED